MSELWRRIVSLSDPQHTANFQYICGVQPLKTCEQNGTSTATDRNHYTSKSQHTEECHRRSRDLASREKDDAQNRAVQQNGIASYQNGSAVKYDGALPHKLEQKNGINQRIVRNGTLTVTDVQNGNVCQCRHEDDVSTARTNGFIHSATIGPQKAVSSKQQESENPPHVIKYPILYYMFSFGASLGNEIFYVLFFSFGLWNFDGVIARKISLIWCVVMYIGQAAKDLACWPRPLSPPAIRLESRYELEYGMPSTHAMVGVAIPFAMLYYTYGVYEYNLPVALVFGLFWCVLVSFSRLFLGMHSVLDITAGIVGSIVVLAFCIPLVDLLDCVMVAHPWCVPGLNIVGVGLCLAYPRLKIWSTARGDTTQVMAVFSGIYQGTWYLSRIITPEVASASLASAPTGWAAVGAAVGRQVVGVVLLIILLETLKKAVIYVSATMQGLDPKDPTCKQHLSVELPYKYIGYYIPSFFAAYLMPVCYEYFGWHRGNYLREVLTHSHHFGL